MAGLSGAEAANTGAAAAVFARRHAFVADGSQDKFAESERTTTVDGEKAALRSQVAALQAALQAKTAHFAVATATAAAAAAAYRPAAFPGPAASAIAPAVAPALEAGPQQVGLRGPPRPSQRLRVRRELPPSTRRVVEPDPEPPTAGLSFTDLSLIFPCPFPVFSPPCAAVSPQLRPRSSGRRRFGGQLLLRPVHRVANEEGQVTARRRGPHRGGRLRPSRRQLLRPTRRRKLMGLLSGERHGTFQPGWPNAWSQALGGKLGVKHWSQALGRVLPGRRRRRRRRRKAPGDRSDSKSRCSSWQPLSPRPRRPAGRSSLRCSGKLRPRRSTGSSGEQRGGPQCLQVKDSRSSIESCDSLRSVLFLVTCRAIAVLFMRRPAMLQLSSVLDGVIADRGSF